MNDLDFRGQQALKHLLPNLTFDDAGTPVRSPLTGTEIGRLATTTAADMDDVFATARRVQRELAGLSFADRRDRVLDFHDRVLSDRWALLDLIQWETGKSRGSAFEEIADVAINARHYARKAKSLLADEKVQGAMPLLTKAVVTRQPKGVVAVISPWNYPFTLTASDAIAAIMAGNAIVLKPDSLTPFTALAVKALLERSGVPEDLFQVVVGAGADLGTPMIERAGAVLTAAIASATTLAQSSSEGLAPSAQPSLRPCPGRSIASALPLSSKSTERPGACNRMVSAWRLPSQWISPSKPAPFAGTNPPSPDSAMAGLRSAGASRKWARQTV